MNTESYDVIVVGTSPVCLAESISQRSLGKSVCIVEKEARIGGAWYTLDLWGFKGLETGCHLLFPEDPPNDRKTYYFLQEILGIELERMEPEPLLYSQSTFKNKSPNPHFYPKHGHQELVNHLWAIAKNEGVVVKNETTVDSVKDLGDTLEIGVHDSSGPKVLKARTITIPAHAHLTKLTTIDNQDIALPFQDRLSIHCSILVEDKFNLDFTHMDIEDHAIDRLSLNRGMANEENDTSIRGKAVICCRLSRDGKNRYNEQGEVETIKFILSTLKECDITQVTLDPLAYQYHFYRNYWRTPQQRHQISEQVPNSVTFINSTDLLESFNERAKDWCEISCFNRKNKVTL